MKVVALIPIKLNNQRLPGKNTKLLNGKPLCSYLFDTIKSIDEIDEKYVYCSDEKIIPYIPEGLIFKKRDPILDGFDVKALDILDRFISEVDADIYIMTHVTEPYTKAESIKKALEKVISGEYDSAFSAERFQNFFWYQGEPVNYDLNDIPRTQDLEPVYMETSGFIIFKKEVFKQLRRRIGNNPYICEIDRFEAIDIDDMDDFIMAELMGKMQGKK